MIGRARVALGINKGVPEFNYTGSFKVVDDNDNEILENNYKKVENWNIKFLTSGVLTFQKIRNAKNIDVFLVGGGGSGGYVGSGVSMGTGGGGGGEAITILN